MGNTYSMGREYVHRSFLINNNIAVPECFDRYFSLSLENKAIPTDTIKKLIYEASEKEFENEIKRIYQEGKVIRLLEEIEAYANKGSSVELPSERASMILKSLTRCWGALKVEDRGFLSVPFEWRFLFCVDPLLKLIDTSYRYPAIRYIFEDEEVQISTLALLLNDFETQHGRFKEDATVKDEQIITLTEVLELEDIFKRRAIEALDSKIVLDQNQGLNFLWILDQIDSDLAKSKKKSIVTDNKSLVKVLSYCTSHGAISGRITSKTWQTNLKIVEEFIDINEAYQRIKIFVTTHDFWDFSEDDQMNVIAFLLTVENKPENELRDKYIVEESIRKELHKLIKYN